MKILILATPRSGSTSLVKFVDSHLKLENYKMFIEPYSDSNHKDYFDKSNYETTDPLLKYDSILVKNLLLVGYDEYPTKTFVNVHEYFEWCSIFFDKILILDRKDKIAQSESFVINETMSRERGINWHTPKIYDLDKLNQSYLKEMINRYTESSKILHDLSGSQNIPIFYYEDIFLEHDTDVIKNLLEYLGMELLLDKYNEFILSPDRRVRIEKDHKKLI
jgi:LPS sulfotransferase NodH